MHIGVSTGQSELGLYPTRDRPNRIGLRKSWPIANRRGWFCAGNTVGSVGTVHGEKSNQNSWCQVKKRQIRQRSNRIWWDLARSGEISLDLDEISLDLLDKSLKYENLLPESENLKLEFGNLRPKSEKSHRNLENLARIWKFPLEFGNFLLEIY